jgi:uncharacterized YigZ family protein
MKSDSYKTIISSSQGIYKEKGSRFFSLAIPVSNQEEIKPILDKIKKEHHEAKHHCYAYIIGQERIIWRVNDDGEPSGTAGKPILGQINSFGLTNIIIVVSRYFGGTLLGVSRLINAYRTSASTALQNADIVEKTLQAYYEITYPYISMNEVMKIIKEENIGQSDQSFGLECRIKVYFRASAKEEILNRISRIGGLKYKFIETH